MNTLYRRMIAFVIVLVFFQQGVFAQESMLACKFTVGQHLRYKITANFTYDGGMLPDGHREIIRTLFYTLDVTSVDREGTATVTFTQDSLIYWRDGKTTMDGSGSSLNGVPITMWISNRGIVVDVAPPADLDDEGSTFLDMLTKGFRAEPPLPGRAVGVGAEWKDDLSVYFIYSIGTLKTEHPVSSTYARKEDFRGRECARIEYSGNLLSLKQKIGHTSGTIHLSLRDGKVLRVSSKTDAAMYMNVRDGRAQMRVSITQTREALN